MTTPPPPAGDANASHPTAPDPDAPAPDPLAAPPGAIPPLLRGLVDDAAIFPPGNLPLPEAVAAHRRHRTAWYADLVGPFLVSDARLPELAALAEPRLPLRVALVVPGGAAAVGPAMAAVLAAPGLVLEGIETAGDEPDAIVAAYHEHVPEDVAGAVEIRPDADLDTALAVLAGTRHRAKFRTGGTTAAAFPSAARLAAFLAACVDRRIPFKLTAGLHRALPRTDPETGFAHHGFLNVLVAAADMEDDEGPELAEGLLLGDDPELAALLRTQIPEALSRARRRFTAFGSCSIAEPLADLISLGLVTPPRHAPQSASRPLPDATDTGSPRVDSAESAVPPSSDSKEHM
jgi:hypothetical protein